MLYTLATLVLLPAAIRGSLVHTAARSTTACNNSPSLCDRTYDNVTYLGAHDSPFLRDSATDYSAAGNQFYNSTVQLDAGVRLLTAQVQMNGNALHVCHTSCELLDAGPLSDWLAEVRSWMESNPDNVVTVLLVNGASATASQLSSEYEAAGITDSLTYTPSGSGGSSSSSPTTSPASASTASPASPPGGGPGSPPRSKRSENSQGWPTLQSMISSGNRLVNFVDYIGDTSDAPFILSEFDYIFENNYDVSTLDGFTCDANRPSSAVGQTQQVISQGIMPFMNHFLYQNDGFGIQQADSVSVNETNAPSGGVGTLGYSAAQCTQSYGQAPTFILVDFFNVGPAIETVDTLNGVSDVVGRSSVSSTTLVETSAANMVAPTGWMRWSAILALALPFTV